MKNGVSGKQGEGKETLETNYIIRKRMSQQKSRNLGRRGSWLVADVASKTTAAARSDLPRVRVLHDVSETF